MARRLSLMHQLEFSIDTTGRGTYDLTDRVKDAIRESGVSTGLCHVFLRHTSASLMLCENADPAVMADLESFMSRLTPDGDPMFTHTAEGPDDMSAHVRSVLTHNDLNVPVRNGQCDLGRWQGIYLWEHRHAPHHRDITVTITGT
ncbi:MAG: secondary thiamine-phosphate synthase enzyme YjbQ [Pseudomonadota bacterium]